MTHWTFQTIKDNVVTTAVAKAGESKGIFYIVDAFSDVSIEIDTVFLGNNASLTIGIAAFVKKGAKISIKTTQHHEYPLTTSGIYIKSVVLDQGLFDFKGAIRVEPKAYGTDAYQQSDTLLLGENAEGVSEPSLEILCDDVKCSHGITCGSVPSDMRWYGQTRGIAQKEFDVLYAKGFLCSLSSIFEDEKQKKQVENYVKDTLQWRAL